jgi:competence protein ComEC
MSANSRDVSYLGSKGVHSISDLFMNIKQRLIDSVDGFMPYPENTLLKGILFGYTADMPDMISEAYSATGMAHILAVSGMNVAFIPLIIYFIIKPFNSKPRLVDGIAIAAIWVYAVISDLSPSVLRAAIMLSVLLGGRLLNRKADTLNSLSIAAIIILIINPLDIYNIGFMLSFAATAALLSIYKPIEGFLARFMPKALAEICAATLAPQIATLPIIAYYFNQIPTLSLLANIAIIPFNGFIFLTGLVLSALGVILPVVASAIAYPLYIILRSVNIFTLAMAGIPWVAINVPSPSIPLIVAYYITICAVFLWRRMSRHQVTSIAVALAFIIAIEAFTVWANDNRLKVVFLDVGQGDSIFISTPSHKNILIDGGNRVDYMEDGFDAGQSIVLPYLKHNGIMHLDLIAYSHPDSDHIGGLVSVMNELRVDTVLYSIYDEEFLSTALNKGARVVKLVQGDRIEVDDGIVFEVLYPLAQPSFDGGNNNSLVLKLKYRNFSLLLPGDIEADAENELIQDADLESAVIKVPHHGSDTSSTDSFIAAVKPDVAVISVGNNNFGQPSDNVIRRYYDAGAQVYRTDKHGAVSIVTDGWNMSVETVIER